VSTITASRRAFSTLTAEGRRISDGELLDAAMAYPRVAAPAWLDAIVMRPRRIQPSESHAVDLRVKQAAAAFLGLASFPAARMVLASSAGLALDRALAAVAPPGSRALVTSPSIDIVPAMLAGRGVTVRHLHAAAPAFALDAERMSAALRAQRPDALVFGAPENPTGAYLAESQLRELVATARATGTALVVDQCAATLRGEGIRVPLLAALDPPDLDWIMVWDTGKSFGLEGDKLAFLFTSSSLAERVRESVGLVEYETPLRVRALVADVLEDLRARAYVAELARLVERNRKRLVELCTEHGLAPVPTAASSLQLVHGRSDCVQLLREAGVGVVPGCCFFHGAGAGEPHAETCFRVALAREAGAFDAILDAIDRALSAPR
jgi:aspartate/methionine/tyrosine aminotransferase